MVRAKLSWLFGMRLAMPYRTGAHMALQVDFLGAASRDDQVNLLNLKMRYLCA
jgi:hypothetical protein